MAGKIEIRKSGEKFRFVVLNRNGQRLLLSGRFDDKPSTKRAASSLAKAVSGAEQTGLVACVRRTSALLLVALRERRQVNRGDRHCSRARSAHRTMTQQRMGACRSLSKWYCASERRTARRAGTSYGVEPHRLEIPITTRRTLMAGKIEIRKSGEKFRLRSSPRPIRPPLPRKAAHVAPV
jgi:hypothetical protein